MAADRTLVDAAFKEATSRAGVKEPNLKPLYEIYQQLTIAFKLCVHV